jgi:hypothetical protein
MITAVTPLFRICLLRLMLPMIRQIGTQAIGLRVVEDRSANLVRVAFNRPVNTNLPSGAVTLRSAGPDGVLNTADDVLIQGGFDCR